MRKVNAVTGGHAMWNNGELSLNRCDVPSHQGAVKRSLPSIESKRRGSRRRLAIAAAHSIAAIALTQFAAPAAKAATYTWTKLDNNTPASNGNWSSGISWSSTPASAGNTTLVFGYSFGANSTAETNTLTNDIANPFQLNVLTLGINTPHAANGSSIATINIAGSPLDFVLNGGTTPQVNLSQNQSHGQPVAFNVQSNVVLDADTLFTGDGNATFTISGQLSGAGNFTKSGASTLTLSGNNSGFSGGIILSGGTLSPQSTTPQLNLGGNGASLTFNGSAALTQVYNATATYGSLAINGVGTTATLTGGSGPSNYTTFTGPVTGNGTLVVTSAGGGYTTPYNLLSTANTFTGPMVIGPYLAETLTANSLADSPGAGSIQLGNATTVGTFNYGTGAIAPLTLNYRQIVLAGTTGGGTLQNSNTTQGITVVTDLGVSGVGNKTLTLSAAAGPTNLLSGNIADGSGNASVISLTKSGTGLWVVSGNNTYSGITTVGAGTLSTGATGVFANGNSTSFIGRSGNAAANLVLSGGTLQYANTGAPESTDRLFTFTASSALDASGVNSITYANTGSIANTAAAGQTLTLTGSGTGIFDPALINSTGNGTPLLSVTKTGSGLWSLYGANSYTGNTTVNAGTLQLNYASNPNVLSSSSPLILGGGTLQLVANGSTTQTLAKLTLTAGTNSSIVLNSNGGNATLTIGNTTVTTGAGANVNFNYYDGGNGTTNGASVGNDIIAWNPTLTNGIIGAAYTVTDAGGSGYATVSSGNVTRYTVSSPGSAGLPQTTGNASLNYFVDSSYGNSSTSAPGSLGEALTGNVAANTVTVDTTGGSGNLTLGNRTLTLTTLGGMLFTGNNSYTITATTGGGLKSSASGNSTVLNNYNSSTVTINAPILANGTSGLTVNGTGVTALGASGNFSGSTTINGGTLLANNSTGSATGSGNITVTAGTSNYGGAKFGGNGSVSGTVTLNGSNIATRGGLIAAGSSSSTVGTFTTGNQTWNGGAAYEWKITGDGTGVTGNQSTVADFLQIGNSTSGSPLSVSTTSLAAFTIAPLGNLTSVGAGPFSWDIAQVGSGNATTISLNGVATAGNATTPLFSGVNNANFALDTSGLAINGSPPSASSFALYFETVGSNNDLVLTYNGTPEPGTAILVLGGAVPMLMGRRRRKMGMKEQHTQA